MVVKVYTPEEVADVFRITVDEVHSLITQGQLKAFRVLDYVRIPEPALARLINQEDTGSMSRSATAVISTLEEPTSRDLDLSASKRPSRLRHRNYELEKQGRKWAQENVMRSATNLTIHTRKSFTADGKNGILCVATTKSGPRDTWWFGFKSDLLHPNRSNLIVAVIADREKAFVVPYEKHKAVIDRLSTDRYGGRKFHIEERVGTFRLTGPGVDTPVDLSPYENAFSLFRT